MRNLETYYINPFSSREISLDNKKKFGEDNIKRIGTQNTGNIFDTILNDTIAVQTALFGGITSVDTNRAIQQSRTQSVDNIIAGFTARNTRLNNYLIATAVYGTPMYQEFFPQGVTQFTKLVDKGNVEQRMTEMVAAVTANTAAAGGATVLAEYAAFLSTYKTARGQQLDKISAVSSGIVSRNQAEANWDDQQFENLLTFAQMHRDHPEMLSLYMNQSILRTPVSADNDGQGRAAGVVTSSGSPLSGVLVHVTDGNINDITTGDDGSYTTQSLPVGVYTIVFSKTNYTTQSISITIIDSGDTLHDVSMQKV